MTHERFSPTPTLCILLLLLPLAASVPAFAGDDDVEPLATLTAGEAKGFSGELVQVPVLLDGTLVVTEGVQFGLAHDDAVLTLESITEGADLLDTGRPLFWFASTETLGGTGGVVAFAVAIDGQLPSEDDLEIVVFEYAINDDAESGTVTNLEFTEELSTEGDVLPTTVRVVVRVDDDFEDAVLTLEDGDVAVVGGRVSFVQPPGSTFVRGDVSGDGKINIGDAIIILKLGFDGGEEPVCLDAVDVDDNGEVSHHRRGRG